MKLKLDRVIGHRGACGYVPENTLLSMLKAYELGTKWVEFDVMLAGSGEPILMHDFTLERTTNGSGEVAKVDYATLSTLDCGGWFSKAYQGLKIPTLSDLLWYVPILGLGINIEVKPTPGTDYQTAVKILDALKIYWPRTSPPPLISSFSTKVLETIFESKDRNHYHLGLIIEDWQGDWQHTLSRFNCSSLHVDHEILTSSHVQKVKGSGRQVLAYTVNDPERAQELFEWGVDSVFTDYPDIILATAELNV